MKHQCLRKHFFKYICVRSVPCIVASLSPFYGFSVWRVAALTFFLSDTSIPALSTHLHMDAVGQDGQAGDGVDEDDLGEGGPGAGAGVDNSGVCHGL